MKSVEDALRELASSDKDRPEIARLRDIFGTVEEALNKGVSREKVLNVLHQQGFTMTLKTFDNALYRIRKRIQKTQKKGPVPQGQSAARPAIGTPTPTARIEEPPAAEEESEAGETASHNPAALDKIIGRQVDLEALAKQRKRVRK